MAGMGTYGISKNHDVTYSVWLFFATLLVYTSYRFFKLKTITYLRTDYLWSQNHQPFSLFMLAISSILSMVIWQWVDHQYTLLILTSLIGLLLYGTIVKTMNQTLQNRLSLSIMKAGLLALTWWLMLEIPNLIWVKSFNKTLLFGQGMLLFGIALNFEIRDQIALKRPLLISSCLSMLTALIAHLMTANTTVFIIGICLYFVLAIYTMIRQSSQTDSADFAWRLDGLIGLYGIVYCVIT
jgi:hypothetical protein